MGSTLSTCACTWASENICPGPGYRCETFELRRCQTRIPVLPFAEIQEVQRGSPGHRGGLQKGDRIICFAYINGSNQGANLSGLNAVLHAKAGQRVATRLFRPNRGLVNTYVTLTEWKGRSGVLGCSLKPLPWCDNMLFGARKWGSSEAVPSTKTYEVDVHEIDVHKIRPQRSALKTSTLSCGEMSSPMSTPNLLILGQQARERRLRFSDGHPEMRRIESHQNLSRFERDSCYYGSDDMCQFIHNEVVRREVLGVTSTCALAPEAEILEEVDSPMIRRYNHPPRWPAPPERRR
uniref:PDZ domain-containing protein n=1 Tax=Octactis speculum TaxID=3111310 RepID=A0A6U3Z996_9STRA|mmetsp:Transcript_64039/g.87987  ORF Transcript_64039/g.87987 Transcript_64039/m.87987 type:complete len:293 (+) Transcript_64039:37-915(+)|eukprot:CAMPEP_0185747932 /NCGR_PEP_ID=MMETSP1174-20130828/6578_1 /TAXON_ID=35687 /ORGANISM="Dictyocha speculum, Strain CCMP1381" /LENGTH=292 /DNA_ID=CAMNT_0028423361 /DNA_START=37 /DNA_END=915 /DNA_ORIENTATION=-